MKKKICLLLPAAMAIAASGLAAATAQAQVVIVNAASSRAGFPVAPGALASAYGAFTGAPRAVSEAQPLPTALGGASVTVGGAPAPLIFVSEGQINLQIPQATPVGVPVPISVNVGGDVVAEGVLVAAETDPALFGVIVNADGSLNGPDSPAERGGVIIVYGTGLGPVDNTPADGAPAAPDGNPLSTGEQPARAFFGGVEGTVHWSGLAPGFVGLWQLNLQVPAQPYVPEVAGVAGPLPLLVTLGGRPSSNREVTVHVAP